MIKLIASDMDGTLLQKGIRVVSDEQMKCIEKLVDGGVLFAPASGRQYTNLRRNFEPIKDKLIYICENGSFVKYKGETLYKKCLDRELGIAIMKDIYNREGCEILLSGEETCYIMPKSESYISHMTDYVKNDVTVIKSFDEVKEDFIKVSVFAKDGIAPHKDYFYDKWKDEAQVAVSGPCWQDFVPTGVHKGSAIECIQERFGISIEETMSFGDNYNDLEMFGRSYYSYAMESAVSEIKEAARYTAPTVQSVLSDINNMKLFGMEE